MAHFRYEIHKKLINILDDASETRLVAQTVVKQINLLKVIYNTLSNKPGPKLRMRLPKIAGKSVFSTDESTEDVTIL